MDSLYTDSIKRLIEQLGRLPGIGPKSAERLAFYILHTSKDEALALADAIRAVKEQIRPCKDCFNLAEGPLCPICADPRRDHNTICVVEQPKDLVALEKTGLCNWVYHVLGGHICPLDGIGPADLTIDRLIERVRSGQVREVVMATNPTLDGDGTALHIASLLRGLPVRITRLARGLPAGSTIEYANDKVLADAILGRQTIQ
ncbi:MAG: recombination mediator RecR [Sedimentisphaerales bacterium]|jgi:recombination protein RecR|nr:recombination mediator RecR [Sedimentisphaerales bacterium]